MGTEGALLDRLQIRPCLVLFRAKPIGKRLFRHECRIEIFAFRPRQDSSNPAAASGPGRVDEIAPASSISTSTVRAMVYSRHSCCDDSSRENSRMDALGHWGSFFDRMSRSSETIFFFCPPYFLSMAFDNMAIERSNRNSAVDHVSHQRGSLFSSWYSTHCVRQICQQILARNLWI